MKEINYFQCEACHAIYATAELAQQCETQAGSPIALPGDIVLAKSGFGWYDGDKSWISNPDIGLKVDGHRCPNGDDNCFSDCCNYSFYYVVGAVHIEEAENYYVRDLGLTELRAHRWQYHLFTRAMSREEGYASGYTYDRGHHRPERVEPQPQLEGAEQYIGRKAKHLL